MNSEERKRKKAEYDRLRRSQRTPEQVQAEKERDKQRRLTMTQDDKIARSENDRKRRQQRTPVQVQKDKEDDKRRRLSLDPIVREKRHKQRTTDIQRQKANDSNVQVDLNLRRRKHPPPSKHSARDLKNKPKEHYLGKMDHECVHCKALHFNAEKTTRGTFSGCCGGGSLKVSTVNNYPEQLQNWLTGSDESSKHFRSNIRKYNSAFAFASFGYQPVKFKSGPQTFVIHGQVYHRTSQSLTASDKPSYAQLYFIEPEVANAARMENPHNVECRQDVMETIDLILREVNPFASAYTMMRDVIVKNPEASVQMWITKDRQHDKRRYNLPTVNEVAAIFVSEDGEPPFERDICYYPKAGEGLQHLKFYSPNCDPMTYPLLFPRGEPGWQPKMLKSGASLDNEFEDNPEQNTRCISMLEFYAFRMQERVGCFNPMLHAGKLTQQFIVDAYLKIEGQRLQWNRQNQQKLRVDLYMGLMDFINSQAESQGLKPGKMVILPSSFTGSKRSLQQNYQDAMALVAKYGKPDLFITFTCNPKWREITEQLKFGETAMDRPDIVARVFHLKLKEFMNDLTCDKGGVLGKVKAYVSVIEFQKRGLPHCHMLIILHEEDKLREPEDIDSVVSAELPDESDKDLLEIIKSCMLHGPCGDLNTNAPCMAEEKGTFKCTKNYPKTFNETTNANKDGFPEYRRSNNGRSVQVHGVDLDNRWVVPYNPWLSRKYNAHINVEVCSTVQSVKYIYKYIYKGHDAAIVKIYEEGSSQGILDWDEIQTFLDTRYLSAPEGYWRIKKYDMYKKSHSVERLPVHLPSQQTLIFNAGSEKLALEQADRRGTKLTKWFQLNERDLEAREYLYCEIPYHYVWHKDEWKKRQRGAEKILPRMYMVSPNDMERYSLRLLLLHVQGAQSFQDLRTVHGVMCNTFLEAARALKLLEDDQEWSRTMDEAVVFRMPTELRQLFAAILIFAFPTDAKSLYENYKTSMYEDYMVNHSEYMAEQLSLRDIEEHLLQFGKALHDFGIPAPSDAYDEERESHAEQEAEVAQRLASMMNTEQGKAFEIIMDAVNGRRRNKCYFLSGAGGCGKTFVYRALTAKILSEGGLVRSVAPTGLAATLLKGGKTVHSGFGIPIDLSRDTVSRIKQGSREWKELRLTKLIIWDEISMCHVHLLLAVDRSLRDLMNCDEPFGGIPIVVGGDFRQQAPVVLHGTRVKIVESCVKSCSLWKRFEELKLTKNMRVQGDEEEFAQWLLTVGSGVSDGENSDFIKIPSESVSSDIVSSVFGEDISKLSPEELASRAILCPKNDDTLMVNNKILSMLPGDSKTYYSVDSVADCESEEERAQYPLEFLHSLTPMGMPPHRLELKKGCCIMLLRNLNPKRGLCNGTRLIVDTLGDNVLECSVFSGDQKGEKMFIPRIGLDVRNTDLPFQFKRRQFPVRLAYSMTITKSQGQTFDRIGVYLPSPVFTHGQLYTAFSRVRSKDGLFVEIKESSKQGRIYENDQNQYTFNCVYREILN